MSGGNSKSEGSDKSGDGSFASLPAITDHDRELASRSMQEFEQGQYDTALQILNELLKLRQGDAKIMHNKAVIEYYQSGLKKTDEFRQHIRNICNQCQVNLDNIAAMDDVDQILLYYNHAVILYRLRQYHSAVNIVDKLFQFIEPLEENLARKVSLLLAQLYLCTHQPEKATGLLSFIEKSLFSSNGGNKTSERESKDGSPEYGMSDVWKARISQYKARCYLMLKSMKFCKREIKNLMNTIGVSPQLVFLKSNFEYLRGNYRKAIKVLNTAIQAKGPMENPETLNVMYFNNMACIHFHMCKHHLGTFYLRKALAENEAVTRDLRKAVLSKSLSGRPVHSLGISKYYELLYNMGIQLLHCGKPLAAFDCLIEVIQVFPSNARLWLRLAECCIMCYRESNEEDSSLSNRLQVIQGSVGSGVHRKLIIGPGLKETDKMSTDSAAIPGTTIEFASLCLQNALLNIPDDPINAVPTDNENDTSKVHEPLTVPAPPGNPMRGQEVANLRCTILCDSAYVALCLNDFLMAYYYADLLIKQPKLSGAHRYLGHMYISEALVALDKIADAIQHLNPDLITDVSPTPPECKHEQEKDRNGDLPEGEAKAALYSWCPKDITKAKAIMQYNLAAAHTLRGEHEKAIMNLAKSTQGIGTPFPAQIYFLRLYLDLMEGRRKLAQGVIKEHFGHMTPNRV
ncbi:CCR4-NOT transcription complex subunit 10-like [Tubulanus polymorphus]|uniref:CCR4-NOT transcription complex subunit 10-like n=1 Tax=Tubulanus polymorphus TaxID=672921 RepID=UPI003DA49CF4